MQRYRSFQPTDLRLSASISGSSSSFRIDAHCWAGQQWHLTSPLVAAPHRRFCEGTETNRDASSAKIGGATRVTNTHCLASQQCHPPVPELESLRRRLGSAPATRQSHQLTRLRVVLVFQSLTVQARILLAPTVPASAALRSQASSRDCPRRGRSRGCGADSCRPHKACRPPL